MVVVWLMWKYERHAFKILGTAILVATLIPMIVNFYYDFDILVRQFPELVDFVIQSKIKLLFNLPSESLNNYVSLCTDHSTISYSSFHNGTSCSPLA